MDAVTRKAYAKVNLVLDITGRRPDGYHDLRTVMQTVDVCDTLTFTTDDSGVTTIRTDDTQIPAGDENLIARAVEALRDICHFREGIRVDLTKEIPVAAGMAGGSADAACTLHAVNDLLSLGLDQETLAAAGVKIGADIPYCLHGGTCLAEGIGEILTPLPAPPPCTLVIAKPEAAVSTGVIYRRYDAHPAKAHPSVDELIRALHEGDLRLLCRCAENVLEEITARQHPVVAELKNLMRDYGALTALMSGSGPTVFGIFEQETDAIKTYHVLKQRRICPSLFVSRCVQG